MMRAGIFIDAWKLPIFKRHLSEAKYSFSEHPGLTPNTLQLHVMTNSVLDLKPIIEAANAEAQRGKAQ